MTAVASRLTLRGCVPLWMGLLLICPTVSLADTAADLAKIEGLLRRAEANLQSVQQRLAGRTSPPKGSAGKLIARNLEQVLGDLEPAGQLVAGLPAGEAGVAEATERYNAAANLYQQFAAFMNGSPGSAQAGSGGDGAREGEVRLGYPHADNFKNVQFTFRNKVEAPANQLTQLHAELRPVEDQLTINHRATAQAVATLAEARRQAGFVQDGLAKLPANGQGVAAAKEQLAAALESLDGSEQYFAPLHARLMAMIDPAKYPEFNADRKRLEGLSSDYRQDWVFTDDRARAAELYQQRQAAQQEVVRIAGAYRRLMQQQTDMGQTIEAVGNGTIRSLREFDAKIEAQRQSLPGSIREDLVEADKYATEAVQNQKPAWFNGGIPQRMGWAQDKLTLLLAIDPENGAAVQQEVTAMQASLEQRADSLRELIIRENELPADNFAGPDRDAAIAVAKSGWAVQQPDADILAVRIPAEAWKRQAKWTYSNGTWYFSDKSRLQVRLIVADPTNPNLAIDRPVNVIKDHEAGDRLIGVPFRSIDEELTPGEYYLREKVK
ncbi:MAG: hypothetical protein AAFX76_00035 [Planctomycetota bacterium]